MRILAIDVGAGTQDILLYESGKPVENCIKLVLPSQTQIVGKRIRAATAAGKPLHLMGVLMGGGESGYAAKDHLAAGLPLSATMMAARTLHNDLERVQGMGVALRDDTPPGAAVVETRDVDLVALQSVLGTFGVDLPDVVAVAVQDHGDASVYDRLNTRPTPPPSSGRSGVEDSVPNRVRFDYLQGLLAGGGDLAGMVYQNAPEGMTRMAAVARTVPGVYVMDTGAAAVLGALGDPVVAQAVRTSGAILVNVGNMHTFAVLVKGRRLYGLFEHHTGGITAAIIDDLVGRLRTGTIDTEGFRRDFDGHGAALDPAYSHAGPFDFVALTGPNRRIARSLGYHEAAPHGDMMLAGAYGLVEGVFLAMAAAGHDPGLTLVAD